MLLSVLAARGLQVPAKARDRVLACADAAQLQAWADRAVTATSLDEVFGVAGRKPARRRWTRLWLSRR